MDKMIIVSKININMFPMLQSAPLQAVEDTSSIDHRALSQVLKR
jgi:hypothetical protein